MVKCAGGCDVLGAVVVVAVVAGVVAVSMLLLLLSKLRLLLRQQQFGGRGAQRCRKLVKNLQRGGVPRTYVRTFVRVRSESRGRSLNIAASASYREGTRNLQPTTNLNKKCLCLSVQVFLSDVT